MRCFHFLLIACLACLFVAGCSGKPAPLNPEHKVDEQQDIIIGSKDAPHEMIIYTSPGCYPCLRLFGLSHQIIKERYVDSGNLRLVFRQVPGIVPFVKDEDGGTKIFKRGQSNSALAAISARCANHYLGDKGYTDTLYYLYAALNENVPGPQLQAWPHYNDTTIQKIFFAIGKKGQVSKEQYETCLAEPMKSDTLKILNRNADIFSKDLGQKTLPAYYLDGKKLDLDTKLPSEELRKILKETFGK